MRRTFHGPPSDTVRSASLAGIFGILVLYTLYFAGSLLLPIYLAVLLSFPLSPLVRGLQRVWVPPPLGAAVVLVLVLAGAAFTAQTLMQPAAEWMARGPSAFSEVERKLRVLKEPLEQVSKATKTVEDLATVGKETPTVELRQPSLAETLVDNTREFVGQGSLVIVLLYFLLAAAGAFTDRMEAAFSHWRGRRSDEAIFELVEGEISRYLLTISLINAGLAVAAALLMYALGMPSPWLWGTMAGVLNFIPFVGALTSGVVIGTVSLLTFDTLGRAALAPVLFYCLTTVEGMFITPALVGRRLLLNPIAVLLALFVFSWLWGVIGALIAVPTLAIFKIICDRIDSMRPVAILMEP